LRASDAPDTSTIRARSRPEPEPALLSFDLNRWTLDALVAWCVDRLKRRLPVGEADVVAAASISRATLCRRLKRLGVTWREIVWRAKTERLLADRQSTADDARFLLSDGDRAMYARPTGGRPAWRKSGQQPESEPR
jgi:hypothetical protein